MFITQKFLQYFLLFIKGAFMGVANKVPGVSGGAVAYVLGFYEELIYSLGKINNKAFGLLFKRSFRLFYYYINGPFLLTIFSGIVFSYFTLSRILDYFLAKEQLLVWSLFFGMIIGSSIFLIKKYKHWNTKAFGLVLLGLCIGFSLNFIPSNGVNYSFWFVFLCGIVSVSGITIPGLSGSYILMLMGNYVFLLVDTANLLSYVLLELFSGNFSVLQKAENKEGLLLFFVFLLGSLAGVIVFSKLLSLVFKKHQAIVDALIIGFIIGSLGAVWPWKKSIYENNIVIGFHKYLPDFSLKENIMALVFVVLGVVIVLGIDRYSQKEIK